MSGEQGGRSQQEQQPQQHGQQSQRGQQQRQPQQQRQRPGGRSATAILGEESGQRFLKYIVGVFAAVGIGYGIGLFLFDAVADGGAELLGVFVLFLPVLAAPIIAVVTGVVTGLRLQTDRKSAVVASGVGAMAGFVVLVLVVIIFAAMIFSGGDGSDGGGNLSDSLLELLAFGLGVATSGALTTYVVKQIEI